MLNARHPISSRPPPILRASNAEAYARADFFQTTCATSRRFTSFIFLILPEPSKRMRPHVYAATPRSTARDPLVRNPLPPTRRTDMPTNAASFSPARRPSSIDLNTDPLSRTEHYSCVKQISPTLCSLRHLQRFPSVFLHRQFPRLRIHCHQPQGDNMSSSSTSPVSDLTNATWLVTWRLRLHRLGIPPLQAHAL